MKKKRRVTAVPTVDHSTCNVPSPFLHVCRLDLRYFKRIHNWVDGRVCMGKQNANVEGFFWYVFARPEVTDSVHQVERKPRDGKQCQDEGERSCELFLFLQIVFRLVLRNVARFFAKASSNGAENVDVQHRHNEEGQQCAK